MAATLSLKAPAAGWLRGTSFDLTFIVGIAMTALLSGAVVIAQPKLFLPVFVLNGWLLGYHHVISTYTRLAFDSDSFREHRFLVLWLPLIVLAGVSVACLALGSWVLTSAYLYWQWWHYMRQSYGVSRIYSRKAGLPLTDRLRNVVVYAVPTFGILYRSYQAPSEYLFTEVKVLPIPFWLMASAGLIAAAATTCWIIQEVRAWSNGKLAGAHTLYLSSHLVIFTCGYILIEDINHGWLVMNIWHNAQYILTVWFFNNSRFKSGVNPRHRFLSTLSQRKNIVPYFAVCLVISISVYSLLDFGLSLIGAVVLTSLPLVAIAYQAINFHHYIVDAVIWKVRKKSVRQNLGVAG